MTPEVIDPLPCRPQGSWRRSRRKEPPMTAYAVAHLRSVDQNAEIVEYLRRIDATLDPFERPVRRPRGAAGRLGRRVARRPRGDRVPGPRRGPGLVRLPRLPGDPPAAHAQLRRRHADRRRGAGRATARQPTRRSWWAGHRDHASRSEVEVQRAGERDARAVGEVQVARGVEHREVGAARRARARRRRRGAAPAPPPAVAACRASPGVSAHLPHGQRDHQRHRRRAHVPGLQSVASATGTPASSSRRASG